MTSCRRTNSRKAFISQPQQISTTQCPVRDSLLVQPKKERRPRAVGTTYFKPGGARPSPVKLKAENWFLKTALLSCWIDENVYLFMRLIVYKTMILLWFAELRNCWDAKLLNCLIANWEIRNWNCAGKHIVADSTPSGVGGRGFWFPRVALGAMHIEPFGF